MPFVVLAAIKCYCILLLRAVKKCSVVTPWNGVIECECRLLVWDFLIGSFMYISWTVYELFSLIVDCYFCLKVFIISLCLKPTFYTPPFFFPFTTNWYSNLFTDEKHALHMLHIYVCEKIDLIDFFNTFCIIFCNLWPSSWLLNES